MRAFCDRPLWWATATVCAMRFQAAQIGGFQNRPICVWSGVRVEPSAEPSALTSLMAAAYFALVSASGGSGPELIGAAQEERLDLRPMGEHRRGQGRRRELVVAGVRPRLEGHGRRGRAVVGAQRDELGGDLPPEADARGLVLGRDAGEQRRVLLVDRGPLRGIELHEHVVGRGVGRRRGRAPCSETDADEVAPVAVVDRYDRVVDRRMDHRQVVGGVDGRRLVAGGGLEVEQELVPGYDRIGWDRRSWPAGPAPARCSWRAREATSAEHPRPADQGSQCSLQGGLREVELITTEHNTTCNSRSPLEAPAARSSRRGTRGGQPPQHARRSAPRERPAQAREDRHEREDEHAGLRRDEREVQARVE